MKSLKGICYAIVVCVIFATNFQCASSKYKLQEQSDVTPSHAYFQEWYAGIKVGGSGMNLYLANLNSKNDVVVDSVFFRRMKGKLVQGKAMYSAILKKPSRHYENISSVYQEGKKRANKKANFPFVLKHNECVVSYIEAGETKYLKIGNIAEKQSIYYENGPPVALNN